MGRSYWFHCLKCGYKFDAFLGVGFCFPIEYQQIMHDAAEGKYGESVQQFLKAYPDGVLNCDRVLLQCTCCDVLSVRPDLSMWIPKYGCISGSGVGYSAAHADQSRDIAVPWDLDRYQLVRHYEHTCEQCGKPMRVMAKDDELSCKYIFGTKKLQTGIHCPVCREKMLLDTMGFWD